MKGMAKIHFAVVPLMPFSPRHSNKLNSQYVTIDVSPEQCLRSISAHRAVLPGLVTDMLKAPPDLPQQNRSKAGLALSSIQATPCGLLWNTVLSNPKHKIDLFQSYLIPK